MPDTSRGGRRSSTLDHVFITRFNLPSEGVESLIRAREDWLRKRVALFERYTIPSVAGQTCTAFHWLVYFDVESPAWLQEKIERWSADGSLTPVFRTSVNSTELVEDLRKVVGPVGDELLTTNLDNDDGLATDFVERLQTATAAGPTAALYLRYGLIKSADRVYLRDDPVNAFCSVREPWRDTVATCWVDWHIGLGDHMPVTVLDGAPGWLQVVHDDNVSNRLRGRLVSPRSFASRFPGLIDELPEPSRWALLRDAVIDRPGRVVRESLRAAAKHLLLKLGGKSALDQAKLLRQRWASRVT